MVTKLGSPSGYALLLALAFASCGNPATAQQEFRLADADGDWQGALACGELKFGQRSPTPEPWRMPINLHIAAGSVSGGHKYPTFADEFSGSVDAQGRVVLEIKRVMLPSMSVILIKTQGAISGYQMTSSGGMVILTPGELKIRDCEITLSNPTAENAVGVAAQIEQMKKEQAEEADKANAARAVAEEKMTAERDAAQRAQEAHAAQEASEKAAAKRVAERKAAAARAASVKAERSTAAQAAAPPPQEGARAKQSNPSVPPSEKAESASSADKAVLDRAAADKVAAEKAAEKTAADRAAAESAAAKAAADRAVVEKAAADQSAVQKTAAEKAAAQKAAADKEKKQPLRVQNAMDL